MQSLKFFAPGSTNKFISCFVHYWPNFKCSVYLTNSGEIFICTDIHGWILNNTGGIVWSNEEYLRLLHDLDIMILNYYNDNGDYVSIHHDRNFNFLESVFTQT